MTEEKLQQIKLIQEAMHRQVDCYLDAGEWNRPSHLFIDFHADSGMMRLGRLTMLHHRIFAGSCPAIVQAAAAVEWLSLSADLLDDQQDQDRETSPWMRLKPDQALLLENSYLLLALSEVGKILTDLNRPAECQRLIRQLLRSLGGQWDDRRNEWASEADYLRRTAQKSGALTALACLTGTLAAGKTGDILRKVADYAGKIGVCAQLRNDFKDAANLDGKNDFRTKKKTAATMFLLHHPDAESKRLRSYYLGEITFDQLLEEKEKTEIWIRNSGLQLYMDALQAGVRMGAEKVLDSTDMSDAGKQSIKKFFY